MKQQYLQTGKIVSTHGVHGEVKLLPWADSPEFLLQFHTLYLDGKPFRVEQSRVQKTCVLVKLAGVDTVEAGAALRDKIVSIDRDKRDWEVKLDNGLDLKFDLQFRLIEIDD